VRRFTRTSLFSFMPSVPRVNEITGHKPADDALLEREWQRERDAYLNLRKLNKGRKCDSFNAWKRKAAKTRSY